MNSSAAFRKQTLRHAVKSQSLFSALILHNLSTTHSKAHPTPTSFNTPHFPVAATGGSWGFGGEHDSTAAQKSPTGVLLTGCPLSSVPISPWPSPHLGRCSEGSTGGRREDTQQNLKTVTKQTSFLDLMCCTMLFSL